MTTALWLLYFADVVQSLSIVLILGAVLAGIGLGIYLLASFIEDDIEFKRPRHFFKAVIGAVVLSVLLPSKSTLYMVAAYRVGDAALQSDTGERAIRALNAWLERQIQPEPRR